MHDAAEAYIGDIARPTKHGLPLLQAAEGRIMQLLASWLELPWPMPPSVHAVDMRMLATERRDVVGHAAGRWLCIENVQPFPDTIEPVPPLTAEAMFLNRFGTLFGWDY